MSVKSAQRALRILECLAGMEVGLTAKEVSDRLDYPQSSTINLMQTLEKEGFLKRDQLKKYRLGSKLIYLGQQALAANDLYTDSRETLLALRAEVNETVFLGTPSGSNVYYLNKVTSTQSIRTSAEIGETKPMYCTGLGKAILSRLSESEQEKIIIETEFEPLTEKTIIDGKTLLQQLLTFKAQGYAVDDEESEEGLYCIAAPVLSIEGKVIAAISCAGPKTRMMPRVGEIIRAVTEAAGRMSALYGSREVEN